MVLTYWKGSFGQNKTGAVATNWAQVVLRLSHDPEQAVVFKSLENLQKNILGYDSG